MRRVCVEFVVHSSTAQQAVDIVESLIHALMSQYGPVPSIESWRVESVRERVTRILRVEDGKIVDWFQKVEED